MEVLGNISSKNIIVHGDFNINFSNKQCKWTKNLKNWETKTCLSQVIRSDTRIRESSSTMIDLCFTNVTHLNSAGTININISDHLATFIFNKKTREGKTTKNFIGRNYNELSLDRVKEEYFKILSSNISMGAHPDLMWDELEDKFLKIAERLCPEREFKIKKDRPAYFTRCISNQITKRDRLFKEARVIVDTNRRKKLWSKATRKRQEVKLLLRKAKRDYITSKREKDRRRS